MFHPSTLKTKTFASGLISILTGAGLCYTGNVAAGGPMIAIGLTAITGRDALSKLLAAQAANVIAQAKE